MIVVLPRPRAAFLAVTFLAISSAQEFRPQIPNVWDDHEVERFEVPLAQRDRSPRHMPAEEYYKLKVRPIYKTYPVYAPGREPAGYIESLKEKEPEIIFDPAQLKTKEDWIRAGKLVFESEPLVFPAPPAGKVFFESTLPPNADGSLPDFLPGARYIIRKKGVLEVGINACAGCHTRVMPDGSYLQGAQGAVDFPATTQDLERARKRTPQSLQAARERRWILYGAPWVLSKEKFFESITVESLVEELGQQRQGVIARQGTSATHPPHIPSLIGIQDLKYLDSTGFARHRSIADLARYAVVNQGLDTMAHYGDFQPSIKATPFSSEIGTRYSDEQLYALGLYLYSLRPPPNPNPVNALSRKGQTVFQKQGCPGCHPAPLYTNNKLTPALGFQVTDEMRKTDDILDVSVGTDPTLATQTRRGTGFYKVPSLRGVWYRNAFGHEGRADTLEEWFDAERLRDDYVAKGYRAKPRAIRGHAFGLQLAPADKQALIAFLKTL